MKQVLVDGVMVTTNVGGMYRLDSGNDRPTMTMVLVDPRESDMDALKRCVAMGYKRVTFYEYTTCVRGYHKRVIYAKK